MKNRFAFQPRYFLFWLLFFGAGRAVFLLYHTKLTQALPAAAVLKTFLYGLRLDASAAAYVSIVPFVLFVLGSLAGPRFGLGRWVGAYSAVLGTVLVILTVADLELYHVWGFRLDDTFVQYLATPAEAAASAGSAPLALLFGLIALLLLGGWALYGRVVGPLPALPPWFGRLRAAFAGFLYLLLLVLPLRGGTQQIPVNQSDVYFSDVSFANHAALNAPWNLMSALLRRQEERPLPPFMPAAAARARLAPLFPGAAGVATPTAVAPSLLAESRPNVLFIILESFTAKLVGHLGGEAGLTPHLDSLARTGVAFEHVYAAGDRSQKGLVALLSGYPSQPTTSIIKYPRKVEKLPQLCRTLRGAGYRSAYYYGGELAFANMGGYLRSGGYERFTERGDFPRAEQNSKWGAHDHVLFRRLLADLRTQPAPFFVTAFTLSSHEPFEVPMPPRFAGTDESNLFRNSVVYTDAALGQFLQEARRQPWYAHTLLVLVADHGHPQPQDTPLDYPAKFHIPLVLAGGALRPEARGRRIATVGAQTDVAATLLGQLGLSAQPYPWSRNLLLPNAPSFAFYAYTDGFGTVGPVGWQAYDNVRRQEAHREPAAVPDSQLRLGQAFEQLSWEDFLKK